MTAAIGQLDLLSWSVLDEVRSTSERTTEYRTDHRTEIEGSTGYGPFDSKTDPDQNRTIPNTSTTEKQTVPPTPPSKREGTDPGGEPEVRSVRDPSSRQEPSLAGKTEDGPNGSDLGQREGEGGREISSQGETAPPQNEPPTPPDLRSYQLDAYLGALRVWSEATRAALVVMPTGTGKTRVIGALARRERDRGGRTLVIAHREELLEQIAGELARAGVIADAFAAGVLEKAQHRGSLSSPAVVASVQSLTAKRLERYPIGHFTKLVVDEAHHSTASGYQRVLEYFAAAQVLGVTATPDRADGKPLGDAFGRVAYTYEIRRAIADEWLVPIRARRITVKGLDLSTVRSHHGDFDRAELAAILANEQMLHACAKPLVDEAGDRKTIVFAVDVPHAHALAEVINRYRPGLALAVDGSASTEQRRAALSLFRRGEIQFLVNCALYTEGFDEPTIACVAMARPTQSRALYTQMLGRGTRIVGATYADSIANGKRDLLVLDFVGNSKHALRGPADALAGSLDDAMRAEVEKALDAGETDVEAAIALAEERAAAARANVQVLALVEYRKRDIDPFLGAQMKPVENAPWANDPATEAQRHALEEIGLGRPPVGITKGEASAILDANTRARKKGLATIPQQRVLRNALKLETNGMTAARATQLILKAKTVGWKPYLFSTEPEARRVPYPLRREGVG